MELTPELQEKKRLMIAGLKKTYQVQYDAIQPIPYIKDRLYCVDNVFVEGGVEVCLASELTRDNGGSWERLQSYKNIYTDFRLNSKRRIIQGEPGYGKSTLTLQLAYDWCNDVWNSSMRNVEILILLRLRQLGGIQSIYRAIKLFLLANERLVTVDDINKIIQSCSSVNIILDGYDEYPDRDSDNDNDVDKMIVMKLFKVNDVTVTTRYLPKHLIRETKRAKLTGFDDKARDEYIRKAVVGDSDEAVEHIKKMLYENTVLADLCQVPLIFVMFAHMAQDLKHLMKFTSVTQFFKYMIKCFHEHLKRKSDDTRKQDFDIYETEHQKLNRIAFEGLNKENQQLTWKKERFQKRVGQKLYDQYILIGLLVEEQVVSVISKDDTVLYTTEVRFYHKLFCEWYAAHHLVTLVNIARNLEDTLKFLDPFDLQYLFRFACGLHPDAGKKLIKHLKSSPGGDTFAILCILEQTGDVNDIMDSVKDLCSRDVKIQKGDSALLQRSTKQLLEIASNNNIPVPCLHLECSSIELEGDAIILHNGILLPVLPTVEKIHIAGGKREPFTDQDILNLCHYGTECRRIKELLFLNLQLPTSFPPEALRDIMETLNIQVCWRPHNIDFHWKVQTCDWEVDSIDSLQQLCSETMYFTDEVDILQQISAIQVIRLAYTHDIPVSCLHLECSSIKLEGDAIILNNGIHLPVLNTVEKIHIAGGKLEPFTDQDILNLCHYGMKCRRITELLFLNLQLPTSFPPEPLTCIMETLNIQVRWRPHNIDFHWKIQTCDWEVDSIDSLQQLCSETMYISDEVDILQQISAIQVIRLAYTHDIPVSCLHLECSSIELEGDAIILNNGIHLPVRNTVEKIHIAGGKLEPFTHQDILNLCHFGMKCRRITELLFLELQLPTSFPSEALTDIMKTLNIQVLWRPHNIDFHWEIQTCDWEVDSIDSLQQLCSETMYFDDRVGILQQISAIQVIRLANNHDIPVSCLHLEYSSIMLRGDAVILHNGTHLPVLTTFEKIHINGYGTECFFKYDMNLMTSSKRERLQIEVELRKKQLSEHFILKLLQYGKKSQHFKELMFDQLICNNIPSTEFQDAMNTSDIQVLCRPSRNKFHWDIRNCDWQTNLTINIFYMNDNSPLFKGITPYDVAAMQ